MPRPPKPTFTFIDLFAGIGGMRMAAERAGGECIQSVEIDDDAFVMTIEARYDLPKPELTQVLGSVILRKLTEAGWVPGPNLNEYRVTHQKAVGVGEADMLTWALDRIAEVENCGAYEKMRTICTRELMR